MPEIAELAKSARSSCKKCKEKIEKGALRLGKQYDDANGHTMTSWYHPQCWKPGKDLARVDEIVGLDALDDEQRALVLSRAEEGGRRAAAVGVAAEDDRRQFGASPPAAAAASSSTAAAPAPAPPLAAAADGGGEFVRFVACDRVASKGGSLDKTEAIKTHVVGLGAADEAYLTVKLLMPGKANDPRAYQLKDKSLIGTLSTALRCSEREMLSHHEGSSDVGLTAEHFYGRSSFVTAPAAATITLADVEGFLDRLADTGTNALALLREIVPRCTPPELRVLCRLISKDLRIATGAAGVVKALGGDGAYARYKAQPSRLRQLVAAARGGAAAPTTATAMATAAAAAAGRRASGDARVCRCSRGSAGFDDPGKKWGTTRGQVRRRARAAAHGQRAGEVLRALAQADRRAQGDRPRRGGATRLPGRLVSHHRCRGGDEGRGRIHPGVWRAGEARAAKVRRRHLLPARLRSALNRRHRPDARVAARPPRTAAVVAGAAAGAGGADGGAPREQRRRVRVAFREAMANHCRG